VLVNEIPGGVAPGNFRLHVNSEMVPVDMISENGVEVAWLAQSVGHDRDPSMVHVWELLTRKYKSLDAMLR
jgi:hypothetical protein